MEEQKKNKILIIDDELIIVKVLERILKQSGYNQIYTSDNCEKGFQLFKEHSPDITFLDMRIPHCSGLELLEKLKLYSNSAKIIVISGYLSYELEKQVKQKGATMYLKKPFDNIYEIPEIVKQVLSKETKELPNMDS